MALREYRFEHPKTERSITIRRWSYLWAGLLGAIYVWWIGTGSILQALAINIAFAVGVNSVAQKDDKHLTRRIDPDGGSGKTCVTERTKRKKISPVV